LTLNNQIWQNSRGQQGSDGQLHPSKRLRYKQANFFLVL